MTQTKSIRGRGALSNPQNRFVKLEIEYDPEYLHSEAPSPKTHFYRDTSKSIIAYNSSPDIGFDASINPYRGCEHGCVYCYARPTHEYLGLSAGIDFETQIIIKENAASLLDKELRGKKWKPQMVAISGVTDCYQPIERQMQLTRACLEVFNQFNNPCCIVTKNALVTRDIDVLQELSQKQCTAVFVSLSSLDPKLVETLEPRTSRPQARLKTIQQLSAAGIPTGVLLAPIVPGLNDHEIPAVLKAVADAGAKWARYIIIRMPYGIKELFVDYLEEHYPNHKNKVIHRIQSMRDGKLNNTEFGERFRGKGIFAEQINQLFKIHAKMNQLNLHELHFTTDHFRVPDEYGQQMFW